MIHWPRFALLFLTLSACEKPQSTEAPTTATPDSGGNAGATDPTGDAAGGGECRPTGCSGTVCSNEDVMTTCEFLPEHACNKTATCAAAADGSCGWTKSAELDACLANPPKE